MKKHVFIHTIALFTCVGCQHTTIQPQAEVIEIKLNDATATTSDVFTGITPIALETTDSSLIGALASVKLSPEYIFVQTDNTIKQFDRNGRFIKNIGRKGQAGDEYSGITDFCINSKHKEIQILDRKQKKILTYDYDGNYQESTPIDCWALQLYKPDTETILTYSGNELDTHNAYKFNVYSATTNNSFYPIDAQRSKYLNILSPRNFYTLKDDNTIFFEAFNDTIYTLDKSHVEPKYILSYSGKNTPPSFFTEKNYENIMDFFQAFNSRDYVNSTHDVAEGNRKLLFSCYYGGAKYFNIYDKPTHTAQSYQSLEENLLMRNAPLVIGDEEFVLWGSDGEAAFWVQPSWLLEHKDRIRSEELQTLVGALKEDDNPILFVGSIL